MSVPKPPERTMEAAYRVYESRPNRILRDATEAALTTAMDPELGDDRLVVAGEYRREVIGWFRERGLTERAMEELEYILDREARS